MILTLSFLALVALALAACAPQEVVRTVVVTQEVQVVQTQVVQQTQVVKETSVVEVQKPSFSTPDPITSDLNVRQAMSYCTNKDDLLKGAYPLSTEADRAVLVMNTFIPTKHWAYAGDANITIYPFDVEKGKSILEADGWVFATADDTFRSKEGNSLSMHFTTTSAAFRKAWSAVWIQQMADCGIEIIPLYAPASWWFGATTGLQRRDFTLGAFAWVGQSDPSGQSLYSCDQIPTAENNWTGQNDMGWCNQVASDAIKRAVNTLDRPERIKEYTIVQQEFTKDIPTIPLFQRMDVFAINSKLTGFAPKTNGNGYYDYNAETWEIPGKDTIVLGYLQEPSTLFQVIDSAMTAKLVGTFTSGVTYISENFDFFPNQLNPIPTLESGQAVNNDVAAKTGDKIFDSDGAPADAAAGVKVKDNTGAVVDFTDGVMMKQLVVTFKWISGMKYSSGNPVIKADFELGYKIDCDKETGAVTYTTCDEMQSVEFVDDTTYVVTYKPGVQDPTYFLPPFSFYDSQLKLSDGRLLKDVPAKEWQLLPEVAQFELQDNVGPYMIKEWVKGQKITMVPNPYFYGGAPKTPNIVISIVTAENAEAQLLAGQVDILDALTITSVDQTLKDAADKGEITLLTSPQSTWEHIDFNLFLP